jgi:hypothetical protein
MVLGDWLALALRHDLGRARLAVAAHGVRDGLLVTGHGQLGRPLPALQPDDALDGGIWS